jgi:hypothetical protein
MNKDRALEPLLGSSKAINSTVETPYGPVEVTINPNGAT